MPGASNKMGINSNSMQVSQPQPQPQLMKNYQQPTQMSNSVQLNNYSSTGANMQNYNRSNYNQFEQNYAYNQPPSRQFSQIPNNDSIFNQKLGNQQQYQHTQQFQQQFQQQYQQQPQPIPEKWEDMLTVVSSSGNLELSERIMEEMGLRVIHEEN